MDDVRKSAWLHHALALHKTTTLNTQHDPEPKLLTRHNTNRQGKGQAPPFRAFFAGRTRGLTNTITYVSKTAPSLCCFGFPRERRAVSFRAPPGALLNSSQRTVALRELDRLRATTRGAQV